MAGRLLLVTTVFTLFDESSNVLFEGFHPSFLQLQEIGDLVIVRLMHDEFTDEDNIEQLGRELFDLVEQFGCRKVILSLEGVRFLTSSVMGKLITLHRKIHRSEGRLVISDLSPTVEDIFSGSRLLQYFRIAGNVAEAQEMLR